jgi:hypothetical protein
VPGTWHTSRELRNFFLPLKDRNAHGRRRHRQAFSVPISSFVSSNLTPAGSLAHPDGEIFRAIRNGVDANGRWLVVMSYTNAGNWTVHTAANVGTEPLKFLVIDLTEKGQPNVLPEAAIMCCLKQPYR